MGHDLLVRLEASGYQGVAVAVILGIRSSPILVPEWLEFCLRCGSRVARSEGSWGVLTGANWPSTCAFHKYLDALAPS